LSSIGMTLEARGPHPGRKYRIAKIAPLHLYLASIYLYCEDIPLQ